MHRRFAVTHITWLLEFEIAAITWIAVRIDDKRGRVAHFGTREWWTITLMSEFSFHSRRSRRFYFIPLKNKQECNQVKISPEKSIYHEIMEIYRFPIHIVNFTLSSVYRVSNLVWEIRNVSRFWVVFCFPRIPQLSWPSPVPFRFWFLGIETFRRISWCFDVFFTFVV